MSGSEVHDIIELPNDYTDEQIEQEHQEWVFQNIDSWWQKIPEPKELTGCSVPDCWHFITLPAQKCICSSTNPDKTGLPGCKGFKERMVRHD